MNNRNNYTPTRIRITDFAKCRNFKTQLVDQLDFFYFHWIRKQIQTSSYKFYINY